MAVMMRLWTLGMVCVLSGAAGAFELHLIVGTSDTVITDSQAPPPLPAPRLPVLFVHGHSFDPLDVENATDDPADPNFRRNFWDTLQPDPSLTLPSFKQTLEQNSGLGIEAYYIRFEDQARSITEDARDIEQAVDVIIRRHNPNFDTAAPAAPPPVQLVIIAYSKGTISTRQYLKSLQTQVQDPAPASGPAPPPLNAPRPNYRPVSEFIAVSPPNHGIAFAGSRNTTKLSVKQLHDGVKAGIGIPPFVVGCGESYNDPQAAAFMSTLNGHPLSDTLNTVNDVFPSEAPGFRRDGEPPHRGVLYVTLYAAGDADAVGGDGTSDDCAGRQVARNLAGDSLGPIAINIASSEIPAAGPFSVEANTHANTVHAHDVICKALFAAVHHKSPAQATCPTVNNVPIIPLPEPAAAILALDTSGSMSLPACPTCTVSRLDVLKDSVELFAQLWSMLGRTDDRLGVTYFSTAVNQFAIAGDTLPMLSNVNAIIADMRAQTPTGLTAIGGALQRSIETLRALPTGAVARRHVILFTDGMQNVNPMVREISANPPQHDIWDEPDRPSSGIVPMTPPMRLDTLSDPADAFPDVTVDTIGIGAGQAFLDLLAAIAAQSGGHTRSTVNAEDLRQFFIEELIETLRGFSPQLVGYRRGALPQESASESFAVNKTARKVLLKVSWPRGRKLVVRAFKDGADVTSSARIASGAFYRILAFDQPATAAAGTLAGEWRLHIMGAPRIAYEAAALVDEPEFRYRAQLGSLRNSVDGPLALSVQVRAGKRPVVGPVEVTALIARPRIAVGNLLASPPEADPSAPEPGMTLAERRLVAVATDPRRWKDLQPRLEAVRLRGDGRGSFQAALSSVTIPGLYRATIRIKGDDRVLGPFERSETVAAMVRFGAADRTRSEIAVREAEEKALEL